MRRKTMILAALAACFPATPAIAGSTPSAVPAPVASWSPPKQCQAWTSKNRLRGSNCFGLMPAQCGADKAMAFRGRTATRRLRARIEAMAPDGVRWIAPGQAVTDDLRHERLNVFLNRRGVIQNMDCY